MGFATLGGSSGDWTDPNTCIPISRFSRGVFSPRGRGGHGEGAGGDVVVADAVGVEVLWHRTKVGKRGGDDGHRGFARDNLESQEDLLIGFGSGERGGGKVERHTFGRSRSASKGQGRAPWAGNS